MLRTMEAKEQLGQSRWKVLTYPRAIIKFIQLVLPAVAIGLLVPFNKVAYIRQADEKAWFNITLKFPFHYNSKTAVYTNETILPPQFEFGQQITICSWMFLGVNAAWFLVAFAVIVAYIKVHGSEKMVQIATVDGIISCSMAVIGATFTGLFCYNVINLRKLVIDELEYVYNGPSECSQTLKCNKHYPDVAMLYASAAVGFLTSVLWAVSIFIALRYSFRSKYASQSGIGGILEMSNDMADEYIERK